jgi:hypothetical protein
MAMYDKDWNTKWRVDIDFDEDAHQPVHLYR